MNDTLRIFIVEKDLLVSADMSETFRSAFPDAECTVFETLAEARDTLTNREMPHVVLVSADRTGLLPGSEADLSWVATRRVIALDLLDANSHPSWVHLCKPFTDLELRAAVDSAVMAEKQY